MEFFAGTGVRDLRSDQIFVKLNILLQSLQKTLRRAACCFAAPPRRLPEARLRRSAAMLSRRGVAQLRRSGQKPRRTTYLGGKRRFRRLPLLTAAVTKQQPLKPLLVSRNPVNRR